MHTSKDDYLINTLRFVSAKEETQIYGSILPESLTSPEIKETKAYKTYFGFATGATPSKKARKFKKSTSPKLTTVPVSTEETKTLRIRKKSMRDFHKTHPSGSGIVTKTAPSAAKIKPSVTSEGTGVKSRSSRYDSNNDQDISGEDSDQENAKDDEDDEEEDEEEVVKTPSNDSNDKDEAKITDKAEGDEDEEMDYTTSQLYDDVDIRLNEPVDTDKGFVQEEGTNAKLTNIQQGNENPEITQVIEDTNVTLSTVPQKTKNRVTSSSYSFDLAAKFLNFSDIPHTDAEIISPMDVHVHHEVPNEQTPTLLTSLKNDPLHTQVTALVDEHLNAKLGATRDEFMNFLLKSLTTRIKKQVKDQLPQILPEAAAMLTEFELKKILIDKMDKSESYLAAPEHRECYEGLKKSYDHDKTFFSTYDKVYSLNRSRNDKDKDEDPSDGSDRGLKKRKTSKDAESAKGPKAKESQSGSSKGDKSQLKSSRKYVQSVEPEFEVADSDMPQDQEENLGNDDEEPKEKAASKHDWFTKPIKPQEPTDPDWNVGKTLQQGQSQITQVKVMKKHGYGYLEEIVVRRADNDLYRFKEGDFPCLRIKDIEDMLLLVLHNQLTSLLGDDVSEFAIALRM
ncbi:hypothetical protein Tco_1266282, partial [Tanacetum coccineum]